MNVQPSFSGTNVPVTRPKSAMILAAGFGKRMRPLTVTTPKPLIEVCGRPLIDYSLEQVRAAGVAKAVVNVHYLAELVRVHVGRHRGVPVEISDESERILDTGGGIANALPRLGDDPFYVLNSDSFWLDGVTRNLDLMAMSWRDADMDALVLLAPTVHAVGYSGRGDFLLDPHGRVRRRPEREIAPFVYAGVAILHPRLFADCPTDPFSLNMVFDRAIESERLFGVRLEGMWFHLGTPSAIQQAEAVIADSAA